MKSILSNFLIELVSTIESSITQFVSTNKCKIIKKVSNSDDRIDEVGIIDETNPGFVKINYQFQFRIARSKNLVQLKNLKIGFFILATRLAFIELR